MYCIVQRQVVVTAKSAGLIIQIYEMWIEAFKRMLCDWQFIYLYIYSDTYVIIIAKLHSVLACVQWNSPWITV